MPQRQLAFSKLIELALLVGKAPIIQFETIEQILKAEATQAKAESKFKRKKVADMNIPNAKIA